VPTKPIDRLLFAQGGLCFFCEQRLAPSEASVEHLVATANGGGNGDDNCVACCKALNSLLGRMSIKEKLKVVLNQKGKFKCPNPTPNSRPRAALPRPEDALERVLSDLRRRGKTRPGNVKALGSTINNLFQKKLTAGQVTTLINKLKLQGLVMVDGAKVTYGSRITSG
jgi:hypothetical protein